ncbi:MAG: sulfotransferase family 2 domain-containing protein [Flavobacteriales bacterium]|nr:sulfotransferase family 2 domain-containing protein [Flavobacteriales bacterium]
MLNPYKFKHFFKNKYLISPFADRKYGLCYNYRYKCLWFRVPKVGSRSINEHFLEATPKNQFIYSSYVGYVPSDFKAWYKFAFVREPTDRFLSCWKDKVLNRNFFKFSETTHLKMKELGNFISWVETQDIDTAEEHLRSQHTLIDLDNLDFLGKLESFDADFQTVADAIGMPLKTLHRMNTTSKMEFNLSDQDRKRIRKLYEQDYELLYPNSP